MKSNKAVHDEPNEKCQEMRSTIISPIGQGIHYPGLFTRRYIKSKKRNQFYLYSTDEEFLFAVAVQENEYFYSISLNANNLSDQNWVIGSLQGNPNNQFTGISFHKEGTNEDFRNSIRLDINSKSKIIQVKIAPPDRDDFIFVDNDNNHYKPLIFNQVSNSNEKDLFNFGLKLDDVLCFTFTQTHTDEFQIQAGYPFSLFQTFCICVAVVASFL